MAFRNAVPLPRAIILLASFALLLALPAVPARAYETFDVRKIPPMPNIPPLSAAEFEAATKLVEDMPMNDETLAYSIRVPTNWTKSDDASAGGAKFNRQIIGEVARFFGPPLMDVRSSFSMMAVQPDHPISVRNWFINHVLQNGYTLQGIQEIDRDRVEGLYVVVEADLSFIVRAVAQRNGGRIVLALHKVPWDYWNDERAMQAAVLSSFTIKTPGEEYLPVTETFSILDLAQFDFPLSWELRAPEVRDLERMKMMLVSVIKSSGSSGWIEIGLVARSLNAPLADELQAHKDAVAAQGFKIGERIEQVGGYTFKPGIAAGAMEVFDLIPDGQRNFPYELWIVVMTGHSYHFIISLVTPSRSTDFYAWAVNSEALGTVITSLNEYESELPVDEDE